MCACSVFRVLGLRISGLAEGVASSPSSLCGHRVFPGLRPPCKHPQVRASSQSRPVTGMGAGRRSPLTRVNRAEDGGTQRCSPTRCGFSTNIHTCRGLFCRRKHTVSKIGNVESLAQNKGMRPTLFIICWNPRTCKPLFQKCSCEGLFLRSGCLSSSQAH